MTFEDTIGQILDARLGPLQAALDRVTRELERIRRGLPPQLVTVQEAAERLGISVSTIHRRIKDGSLPAKRVGRSLRVDLAALHGPTEGEVARAVADMRAG